MKQTLSYVVCISRSVIVPDSAVTFSPQGILEICQEKFGMPNLHNQQKGWTATTPRPPGAHTLSTSY